MISISDASSESASALGSVPDRGRSQRQPGEASAVADRRGGPGNFGGTNYQTWYAVMRIASWLQQHWGDPTAVATARCEARVLQIVRDGDPGLRVGQHGFDFALTDVPNVTPDFKEVKRAPSKAEIVELVSSLRHLPGGEDAVRAGLVAESSTRDYGVLGRLRRLAGEVADDADLAARVAAINDPALTELLKAVGSDGHRTARVLLLAMGQPELWPATALQAHIAGVTQLLTGSDSGGQRLRDFLFTAVSTASQSRGSLQLRDLQQQLMREGRMQSGPAAAASTDPEDELIAAILVVLETCPVPVPKGLLARAAEASVAELEGRVRDLVAVGRVQEVNGGWTSVAAPGQKLASGWGGMLVGALLEVLSQHAAGNGQAAAGQTLNALELAKACQATHVSVVAGLFVNYDHHCKAWGDLAVVRQLADLSEVALQHLLQQNPTAEETKRLAALRAQTYICGQGWVLQRVDALDEAVHFMESAREIAAHHGDAENEAFTLKCQGRLHRMQAELCLDADPDEGARLLAVSAEMLRGAVDAFEALDINPDKARSNQGESASLLARTLATVGDYAGSREAITRAEELLAEFTGGKAYADLQILKVEVDWASSTGVDVEEGRTTHLAEMRSLLSLHDRGVHEPGLGSDRGASEIVARVHLTIALLLQDSDRESAADSYEAAATIYRAMNYTPGFEDALWQAKALSADLVPADLLAALDRARASSGARLRALDEYMFLSTSDSDGDTMGGGASQEWSVERLDRLVEESKAAHAAAAPRWDWGRATA